MPESIVDQARAELAEIEKQIDNLHGKRVALDEFVRAYEAESVPEPRHTGLGNRKPRPAKPVKPVEPAKKDYMAPDEHSAARRARALSQGTDNRDGSKANKNGYRPSPVEPVTDESLAKVRACLGGELQSEPEIRAAAGLTNRCTDILRTLVDRDEAVKQGDKRGAKYRWRMPAL